MNMSISRDEILLMQEMISDNLRDPGYILLKAEDTFALTNTSHDTWNDFALEWDNLKQDEYMADGGKYRFRRYSSFDYAIDKKELQLRVHEPYIQSYAINSLNGGVERFFEPCTSTFLQSPILQNLLLRLGEIFYDITSISQWNIRLHPYRIMASATASGKPAPEGRHRDGVTYIMTMMIKRHNVIGGESGVYHKTGEQIFSRTLQNRGELLIGDDEATTHSVTPIVSLDKAGGYRDVLVIAFTKNT